MDTAAKKQEQKKFLETKEFIESEISRMTSQKKMSRETAIQAGKKYAEDNPYGSMYGGDPQNAQALIDTQMLVASELERYERMEIDMRMLKKLLLSPYFSRIDLKKDCLDAPATFYIGLKNLYDKENHKTLISDWRAPVAELFYNEFDGKAHYEAPIGTIEGDILLKRQFKFENGELKYFFNSDLKINDDILQEVLSEQSQDKLKVIVSSIQREQNTAIRHDDGQNLAVFGPAGSGKTSIGLHRAAYILYKNRSFLTSKDIMLFSNSNIFSSYISDIIPELGEEDIIKTDFFDILVKNINPAFRVLDYYEQANALLSKNGGKRRRDIKIKYSDAFLDFIQDYISNSSFGFKDICVFDETVISRKTLSERFFMDSEYKLAQRRERLKSYCQSELEAYFDQMKPYLLTRIEETAEPFDDPKQIFRVLRRDAKQQMKASINESMQINEIEFYRRALKRYCSETGVDDSYFRTLNSINRKTLNFEDALLVLYIKILLGTAEKTDMPKHVLIDEAQDFCPLQHIIIKKLCHKSAFTLLADTNQGLFPEVNTLSKEELARVYGANIVSLTKSYRSTRQINELALSLLENERYDIFNREGENVHALSSKDHADTISELINSGTLKGKSSCIITTDKKEALNLHAEISKQIQGVRLIDERTDEFSGGILIMPLVFTKGLEFDNVIIPHAEKLCGKENRRALYLMVTRALHRLYALFGGEVMFPFLPDP